VDNLASPERCTLRTIRGKARSVAIKPVRLRQLVDAEVPFRFARSPAEPQKDRHRALHQTRRRTRREARHVCQGRRSRRTVRLCRGFAVAAGVRNQPAMLAHTKEQRRQGPAQCTRAESKRVHARGNYVVPQLRRERLSRSCVRARSRRRKRCNEGSAPRSQSQATLRLYATSALPHTFSELKP